MDFSDFIALVIIVLLIVAVCVGGFYMEKSRCHTRTLGIGEYKYVFNGGCLVQPKGTEGYIPLENYRVI